MGGGEKIWKCTIYTPVKKEQRVAEHWRDANPDAFDRTKPIDYVCSDHFLPKDAVTNTIGRKRLINMYVMPKIFNTR